MNKVFLSAGLAVWVSSGALGQVDVEHRRTVMGQTSFAAGSSQEPPAGLAAFWFNENHYPWPDTALRVFCAGIYNDAELSWFLNPNTAVGGGLGGGWFVDSIYPYADGERLDRQEFYGDSASARVFVNQTIPNRTPLPLNLRGTYGVSGSFYRQTDSTRSFLMPHDFVTHTLSAELRFGGIEPGLTARRGAELYFCLETNYREGFERFGPKGALFPEHDSYQRVYGSLAGKIPLGQTTVAVRVGGGVGGHLDELSAWKLGGNLIGFDSYALTLHGYYTREFLAANFGLVNLEINQRLTESHQVTAHLYGDYAVAKNFDVTDGTLDPWHGYFGVGAGLSFRAFWGIDLLVSYGYGVNALRDGHRGAHEIGLAIEKKF